MTLHADDLSAATRARLGLPKNRSKPSRAGTGGPQRTTCSCGEVFERFEAAERHAQKEHHVRLEVGLYGPAEAPVTLPAGLSTVETLVDEEVS